MKQKTIIKFTTAAALVGILCSFATISSSAFSGEIKWEAPTEEWQHRNNMVFAHIWNSLSNNSVASWQSAEEKMTDNKDGTYSYNVPEGDWNLIVISGLSGDETYDTTFSAECIGDTMYATGEYMENPVDSTKHAVVASWKNHSNYGPHKCISSLGKVIGTSLATGETNQDILDCFISKYKSDWSGTKPFDEVCDNLRQQLGITSSAISSTSEAIINSNSSQQEQQSSASSIDNSSNNTNSNLLIILLIVLIAVIVAFGVLILLRTKKPLDKK